MTAPGLYTTRSYLPGAVRSTQSIGYQVYEMDEDPQKQPAAIFRLIGDRFNGATLPLDALDDLKYINEAVMDVARRIYLLEHNIKRLPKGFGSKSLCIRSLTDGSASMGIDITANSQATSIQIEEDKAIKKSLEIVASTLNGTPVDDGYRDVLTPYFKKIGRQLKDGEILSINTNGAQYSYDTDKRNRLVQDLNEYESETELYGNVVAMDGEARAFTLEYADSIGDGSKVSIPYSNSVTESEIVDAFVHRRDQSVLIRGLGIYKGSHLKTMEDIQYFESLDPCDVRARIETLIRIPADEYGEDPKPDIHSMREFASRYESMMNENLPLPFIFPGEDGGLSLEWDEPDMMVDIDLKTYHATVYAQKEMDLDLSVDDGWKQLSKLLGGSDESS